MNLEVDIFAKYVERLLTAWRRTGNRCYQSTPDASVGSSEPSRIRPSPRVEDAIEDIRNGKMVVVVDSPDRENEGDLCMAAEFVTARRRSTSWPRTPAA